MKIGIILVLVANLIVGCAVSGKNIIKFEEDKEKNNKVELLILALGDENIYNREAAARKLGKMGDPRAVEALCAGLKDEDWRVRRSAALSLGKIGDRRAVKPLTFALRDEEFSVTEAASWALNNISTKYIEMLSIAHKDENDNSRKTTMRTSGKIGDKQAAEPLRAKLRDKDWRVRKIAADELLKIGWQPKDEEEKAWFLVASRKWNKAGELGAPAVEPLITALQDEDNNVRLLAAVYLGKIGDARAIEPLITVLDNDNDEKVCNYVTATLRNLTGKDFEKDAAGWRNWWEQQQ